MLERQRTSPGSLEERSSLRPAPGQVQKGQGRPPEQEESLEVSRAPVHLWWAVQLGQSAGGARGAVKTLGSRDLKSVKAAVLEAAKTPSCISRSSLPSADTRGAGAGRPGYSAWSRGSLPLNVLPRLPQRTEQRERDELG